MGGQTDTYAYDAENRLVSLSKSTTDTGTPGTYTYSYDYRTRRIERAETIGGTTTTTSLVFSGGTSAQEYAGTITTSNLAAQYVRGSDWGGGVGGLLYSVRGGTPSFKHYNARGDILAESNATGATTWRAQYDAYGTRSEESGTPSADRQRGNTKDEDPSGFRNDGFRYYDLDAQIYVTADPAGFVDGPNLYCYVVQNPWSRFDPDGQFWSALVTAGFAAYDTYQYATGKMSGAQYARSMAVNGAALAADVLSAGMGGGMAVRAAAVAQKVNRVVQRADNIISAGESLMGAAEAAQNGDMRGAVLGAASGLSGIVPGNKGAKPSAPGARSAAGARAQTSAIVAGEAKAAQGASKAVHGNSLDSTKAQHGYVIKDKDGNVVKTGISGTELNADGKSPRAEKQVGALNKKAGEDAYSSEVIYQVPEGEGARRAAVDAEKRATNQYAETLDENIHKRPKPDR